MASGQDIFPVMQACVIMSWFFYQEGRWVEVWIFAGFQTRVAVPLRLNYPGTFAATQGGNSPGAYLAPPKDSKELESRRRTWWMTIMFDRIVSVGGWLHGVDERDIGTEFPLRGVDFERNVRPSFLWLLDTLSHSLVVGRVRQSTGPRDERCIHSSSACLHRFLFTFPQSGYAFWTGHGLQHADQPQIEGHKVTKPVSESRIC